MTEDIPPQPPGEPPQPRPTAPDSKADPSPAQQTGAAVIIENARRVYTTGPKWKLNKSFSHHTALDGVSLKLNPGTITALLGPNGSGKSTLLRMIAGIEPIDGGDIWVLGTPPARLRPADRRALGIVFQNTALDPLLTIRENLLLQAALVGINPIGREEIVRRAIDEARLTGHADNRVSTLSGGLARRADLARALIGDIRILLIDEPTAGLDLDSRRLFWEVLAERTAKQSLAVLVSTHDFDEAATAHNVTLLNKGTVVAQGTPAQLIQSVGDTRLVVDASHQLQHLPRLAWIPHGNKRIAHGSDTDITTAAHTLIDAGIPCEFGPGTLEDVYMLHAPQQTQPSHSQKASTP